MKKLFIAVGAVVALAGITTALAVASGGPSAHSAAAKAKLGLRSGKLGRFLVDGSGRTLYLFEKDKGGKSACSGACAQSWPPLTTSGKASAGKGVKASKIGSVKRSDGTTQVTYNHHPLYRFSGDQKAGQTKGEGLKAFGAEWYVLSASGGKIEDEGAGSSSSSSGGGGGY